MRLPLSLPLVLCICGILADDATHTQTQDTVTDINDDIREPDIVPPEPLTAEVDPAPQKEPTQDKPKKRKKKNKSKTEPTNAPPPDPRLKSSCESNDQIGKVWARPPKKASLSFCKQFNKATCCNRTHTDHISRTAFPYFDEDFSETCRQWAVSALCSPCDPLLGVGFRTGLCPSLCEQWFQSCRDGMYTSTQTKLVPCHYKSVVCARLDEIVDNGRDFCEMSGFRVATPEPDASVDGTPYAAFLPETEAGELVLSPENKERCFDGREFVQVTGGTGSRYRPRHEARRDRDKSGTSYFRGRNPLEWLGLNLATPLGQLTVAGLVLVCFAMMLSMVKRLFKRLNRVLDAGSNDHAVGDAPVPTHTWNAAEAHGFGVEGLTAADYPLYGAQRRNTQGHQEEVESTNGLD